MHFNNGWRYYPPLPYIFHSYRLLQQTLDLVETWSYKNGFRFSLSKTKMIIFSNRKRLPHSLTNPLRQSHPSLHPSQIFGSHFRRPPFMDPPIRNLKSKCLRSSNTFQTLTTAAPEQDYYTSIKPSSCLDWTTIPSCVRQPVRLFQVPGLNTVCRSPPSNRSLPS